MQQINDELINPIMQHKAECGCAMGTKFMLVALMASVIWTLSEQGLSATALFVRTPLIVFISILAAGLGKVVGILHARYN
jgi:hypothetical protein